MATLRNAPSVLAYESLSIPFLYWPEFRMWVCGRCMPLEKPISAYILYCMKGKAGQVGREERTCALGKPNVYFLYLFLLFLTFLQKSRESNPLYFFFYLPGL